MEIKELSLKGPKLLAPRLFHDNRGYFFESHRPSFYKECGIVCSFVQDNHSYSLQGVVRGMHYQIGRSQAKLVRVAVGKIYDVVVDIRPESPTFGKWEGIYLDGEEHKQLFIPPGFAHGFQVLSPDAHVLYKVSTPYQADLERAFRFDDPHIGIVWPLGERVLSKRDLEAPFFNLEAT